MTKCKLCLAFAVAILFESTSFAEVRLPAIVSSNMVLQRNTTITLWGWADATVAKEADTVPREDIGRHTGWQSATPASVRTFSAVSYFYGQQLQEILDVPVGMIHTSWGGSLVEAWMSTESLGPIKEVDLTGLDLDRGNRFPTVLFNAMINPLIPYTIKEALWYQGESNASRPEEYEKLFPAMVNDWRTRWGIGDFPFYYVQIAPYEYDWDDATRFQEPAAGEEG